MNVPDDPAFPPDTLLEVHGLVKSYRGRCVVNDVSFRVGEGEIVGLLGPNGAGKTTSFRMTVGLIKPEAGQVWLLSRGEGRSIRPEDAKRIS